MDDRIPIQVFKVPTSMYAHVRSRSNRSLAVFSESVRATSVSLTCIYTLALACLFHCHFYMALCVTVSLPFYTLSLLSYYAEIGEGR